MHIAFFLRFLHEVLGTRIFFLLKILNLHKVSEELLWNKRENAALFGEREHWLLGALVKLGSNERERKDFQKERNKAIMNARLSERIQEI
jgi:hypothetical protein